MDRMVCNEYFGFQMHLCQSIYDMQSTDIKDIGSFRDERDENEIKRLAELHFEQRKEDDAKLEELANLIETTKQVDLSSFIFFLNIFQKRKITRKERAEEANRRNKIIEADEKRRKEKQKLAER